MPTPDEIRATLRAKVEAKRAAQAAPATPTAPVDPVRAALQAKVEAKRAQAPAALPAHMQRPTGGLATLAAPSPQDIADQRNVGLLAQQQTGLQRLRGLVGGEEPRTAPDLTPVYITPESQRPMTGGVPLGEALADAATRPFEGAFDTPTYVAQRGIGGVQNIGEGIVAGGLSLGQGMGMDSLPSPEFIAGMREERQMRAPNSAIEEYGGDAAELVGNLGPVMFGGPAGIAAGAAMGGGEAAMQGKSGLGQLFNAGLNAVPGMRFRVPGLGPAAGQIVGGGAVNAAIPLATAAETTLFEDNPELALQELDQIAPEGATGLALETAVQLATRRRAPRPFSPIQHGAPTQAYAPNLEPLPSQPLVVPEGGPAPYSVTPEVIQAVRDNPQVTTGARDIAENLAANTPDNGPSPQQDMAAEAAKKKQLNLIGDEAVQAKADLERRRLGIQRADGAALRQQEVSEMVDNAIGEKPRGLTELDGRPPDAAPRDVEKARFEGGQRAAEQIEARFQADLKDIIRQRNEGLIGKPQAGALRAEATARRDAALAPQITKAADTAEVIARTGEPAPVAPGAHKMYHGSSRGDITSFDTYGGEYGLFGDGGYFTSDPSIGASYKTKGKGGDPALYEAEVNVKNPLDMDAPVDRSGWLKAIGNDTVLNPKLAPTDNSSMGQWLRDFEHVKTNADAYRAVERAVEEAALSRLEGRETVLSIVREMGYDSISHVGGGRHKKSDGTKHRVYIAFDPEQVTKFRRLSPEEEGQLVSPPAQPLSPAPPTKTSVPVPTRAVEPPPPATPDYAPAAQKLPEPVALPEPSAKIAARPGYKHLSDEARNYVAALKPGQRKALGEAVHNLKRTPTDNDTAYLKRSLGRIEGMAGRPPLAVGEKLPPPPPRTPPPPKPLRDDGASSPSPKPEKYKRHGLISRFAGLFHERQWKTLAKKHGGEKVARLAQATIDRAAELRGKVSNTAYKANKALTKDSRASLQQERTEGQFIYARIHDVLEKRSAPRPEEQKFFDRMKELYYATGRQKQLANMKIKVKNGLIPFTADKERISAPRIYTEDFIQMAQQPNHPDTLDFVKNLAEANPDVDIQKIRDEMADIWRDEDVITMRGMAEDSRVIKNMPTHFRTKDGRVIPIQSTDPLKMVAAMSDRTTARTAFVEHFGQEATPEAFQELIGNNASPEVKRTAKDLFRNLNQIAIKDPGADTFSGLTVPSGKMAKAKEILGSLWSIRKLGALSTAGIANAPELAGKPATIAGRRNVAKALKTFLATRGEKREALLTQLENEGAITRTLMDWFKDKRNYTETITRYITNAGHSPVHLLNEVHEAVTAMAMKTRVEQIREGKGGAMDRLMLMDLDFTQNEIKELMRGGFTDREAQKIVRRGVEWALSSTSQPAEVSRMQNSNAWKFLTVASKFGSANFNRNFHVLMNAYKSLHPESGVSWDNQVKHVLQAVAPAALHVGNAVVNQTAAAGTAMLIRAALLGALGTTVDKATGSNLGMADFVSDAFKNAFLQGTVQSFAGMGFDDPRDRSLVEKAADTMIAPSVAQDIYNFAKGEGKYQEMPWNERAREFVRGSVSASGIGANIAHILGMKQMQPETTAAIKAAMDWRGRYAPSAGGYSDTTSFSAARRAAEKDIEAGRDPWPNLMKALDAKDGKTLASSLKSRRILDDFEPKKTDSEEKAAKKAGQLEAMEKYLGPRTMSRIRQYDAALEQWAEDVKSMP